MLSNIEAAHPTKQSYRLGPEGVIPLCHLCHVILDSGDERKLEILVKLNQRWLGTTSQE